MQRLLEQYCMHTLTPDERVTCESMLSQEPSSRVLVMPTHHINELGDMMGFRYASWVPVPPDPRVTLPFPQVLVPQVRDGQLPACGAYHVPRAHAGGVPGGRGDDHAADVGAGGQQAAHAGVSGPDGARVCARVAGLRAGERERGHAARGGAGAGPADGGQPALDARGA